MDNNIFFIVGMFFGAGVFALAMYVGRCLGRAIELHVERQETFQLKIQLEQERQKTARMRG